MPHSHEADPEEQEDQCTALKRFLRYAFEIVHRAGRQEKSDICSNAASTDELQPKFQNG